MTDSRAAVGFDRLPWLSDEEPKAHKAPDTKPRASRRELAGWGVAGALLLAGGSYWVGTQTAPSREADRVAPAPAAPSATVQLPQARSIAPTPQVALAPVPQVQPAPAPTVAVPAREKARRPASTRPRALAPMDMSGSDLEKTVAEQQGSKDKPAPAAEPAKPVAVAAPVARAPQPLRLWPSRQARGASGRLVQIGAFGSRQQAKLGWRRMTRAYPAVGRLPAVVVASRNSHGRMFYRFQIGTTSQAHSEVLCQRMSRIRFSCAVVGLPWKAKVER